MQPPSDAHAGNGNGRFARLRATSSLPAGPGERGQSPRAMPPLMQAAMPFAKAAFRGASVEQLRELAKAAVAEDRDQAWTMGAILLFESAGLELPTFDRHLVGWTLCASDAQVRDFARAVAKADAGGAGRLSHALDLAVIERGQDLR